MPAVSRVRNTVRQSSNIDVNFMKTFAASNVAKVQAEPISGDFEDEFERYLKDSLLIRP